MSQHLQRIVSEHAAQAKEDKVRWAKDYPFREPGHSLATWKTYSRQRRPSEAFREGYDQIEWRKP